MSELYHSDYLNYGIQMAYRLVLVYFGARQRLVGSLDHVTGDFIVCIASDMKLKG